MFIGKNIFCTLANGTHTDFQCQCCNSEMNFDSKINLNLTGQINEDGATTMAISLRRMMIKPANNPILMSKTGELICILKIVM